MNRRHFLALSSAAASAITARGAGDTADAPPLLSFGLITDVQYADVEPSGERHYRDSVAKLSSAVASLAKEKLPFTLHLGDFIDHDYPSYATVLPLLDGLGHPVHHLLGNHDYGVAEDDKCRVVSTLGMPHDYYLIRSSGVRLLMLDTNDLATYKHPQGSVPDQAAEAAFKALVASGAKNAQPWNGGISESQLAWIDRELAAADAAKERVILCGHHPLLPADGHQIWNNDAVIALIDKHPCVAAYINGHNHAGAEFVRNGVPYITFKSVLHEPDVTAFAVLRWYADRLVIEGRGREKSRSLPLQRSAG